LNIWRAAKNAELEAAKRADLMLDRGDDEGRIGWPRIRRAIEARQAPPSGRPHQGAVAASTQPRKSAEIDPPRGFGRD
jgi:hypothetical protein